MHKCRWKWPKKFWNSLRPLMHSKRSPPNGYITLIENNTIIKDQNLVVDTLNSYFTNVVDSLDIQPYTTFENQPHVSNIPKYWNHKQFDFSLTNHELVKSALEKINANKARGHEHIPPRALKASILSITPPLSHLINTIISSKEVPSSWKRGEIVPHFKKDSQLEKVNYRPVTVLSSLSKIFEHILHQQLADHFENIFHKYRVQEISRLSYSTSLSHWTMEGRSWQTQYHRHDCHWFEQGFWLSFTRSYLGETKILWPKWWCVIFNA